MTELNVTSPTGIVELTRDGDLQVAKQLFDAISSKLENGVFEERLSRSSRALGNGSSEPPGN
jgi:hypothetical protein